MLIARACSSSKLTWGGSFAVIWYRARRGDWDVVRGRRQTRSVITLEVDVLSVHKDKVSSAWPKSSI